MNSILPTLTRTQRILSCIPAWLLVLLCPFAQAQNRPSPVMEMASVIGSLDVRANGLLALDGDNEALTSAFLPQGAPVQAVLTMKGSTTPIHVQDFYVNPVTEVFSRMQMGSKYKPYTFTKNGEYVVTYISGRQELTKVAFTVASLKSQDQFDPRTVWYATGPWEKWAYVYTRLRDGAEAQVGFHMWAHRVSLSDDTESDIYEVLLKKDGDIIAVSSNNYVSGAKWRNLDFPMVFPESKGGRPYRLQDMVARDGTYDFIVMRDEELYAVHQVEVKDGKLLTHSQQAGDYQPRSEYIVPRYAALHTRGQEGNTYWMERLDVRQAQWIASGAAAKVAGPSEEQRAQWDWLPRSIDPNRGFELQITDIETRSDTHLAVARTSLSSAPVIQRV